MPPPQNTDISVLTESQLDVYEYFEKFLLYSQHEDLLNQNPNDTQVLSTWRVKALLQKLVQMKYISTPHALNAIKNINFQLPMVAMHTLNTSSNHHRTQQQMSFDQFLSFLKIHGIYKVDQQDKHEDALKSAWEVFDCDTGIVQQEEVRHVLKNVLRRAAGGDTSSSSRWDHLWNRFDNSWKRGRNGTDRKEELNEIQWRELWNGLIQGSLRSKK